MQRLKDPGSQDVNWATGHLVHILHFKMNGMLQLMKPRMIDTSTAVYFDRTHATHRHSGVYVGCMPAEDTVEIIENMQSGS